MIRPIRTEDDYQAALRDISTLVDLDPDPDSPEGERLDILTTLCNAYEDRHFPMDMPDPVAAIEFRMEQQGLSIADLGYVLGSKSRASEVLNRKRGLSMEMVRRINAAMGIPTQVLIREPRLPIAASRKARPARRQQTRVVVVTSGKFQRPFGAVALSPGSPGQVGANMLSWPKKPFGLV